MIISEHGGSRMRASGHAAGDGTFFAAPRLRDGTKFDSVGFSANASIQLFIPLGVHRPRHVRILRTLCRRILDDSPDGGAVRSMLQSLPQRCQAAPIDLHCRLAILSIVTNINYTHPFRLRAGSIHCHPPRHALRSTSRMRCAPGPNHRH